MGLISRIGGKHYLATEIVSMFPKDNIKLFVEPFVGGGSIYLKQDYPYSVINDLDKDIYDIWRDVKKVPLQRYDFTPNKEKFYRLRDKTKFSSRSERLYRNLYLTFVSYRGNRRSFGGHKKLQGDRLYNKMEMAKEKLKNTKILNQDYKSVIKKYGSPNTFFYL